MSSSRYPAGRREHDANADLPVGRRDDIQGLFVMRHQRTHVLNGRDPVLQAFNGAQHRPHAELGLAPLAEIGRLGMQGPDVERRILYQALNQGVVGVIVRIDEAGHDQFAASIDHVGPPSARVSGEGLLDMRPFLRFAHRRDGAAFDDDVAHPRQINIAVRVPDASPRDQQRPRLLVTVLSSRHDAAPPKPSLDQTLHHSTGFQGTAISRYPDPLFSI